MFYFILNFIAPSEETTSKKEKDYESNKVSDTQVIGENPSAESSDIVEESVQDNSTQMKVLSGI